MLAQRPPLVLLTSPDSLPVDPLHRRYDNEVVKYWIHEIANATDILKAYATPAFAN
jgi:hypothetical protein